MNESSNQIAREQFVKAYVQALQHPEHYDDMFEGYENNHDKALGLISWQALQIESLEKRLEISEGMLKTGAWEKSDAVKKQQVLLQSVRRDIHDKAVYSHSKSIKSYVTLKVVDAIIGNYLRELEEKRSSE